MNPLSVSVDLPVLDVSCEWNHTLGVLLRLASLSQHRVLKVHPRCSECQCFSPLRGGVICLCMGGHAVYPLPAVGI